MKTINYVTAIVVFLSVTISKAQQNPSEEEILKKTSLKMEAINGEQTKVFEGKYGLLDITERNSKEAYPLAMHYASILFKKSMLVGATTIHLYFERENQLPYSISIPNTSDYVFESTTNCDLAAIYLGSIKPDFEKNKLIEPIFYANEDIPSVIDGVTENDLNTIKEKMAIKIFEKQ